ncbi:MAG: hypothetical protein K8R06_01240, partial [Methanosarcinales archaeon]|nr:hypothetical protein [Methanosarcinales archaeon]
KGAAFVDFGLYNFHGCEQGTFRFNCVKKIGTSFYPGTVSISNQFVTFFNKNMDNLVEYG